MIEQEVKIIFNRRLGEKIYLLGIEARDMGALAEPGQFIMLRVDPGIDPLLRRPFSICGQRDEKTLLILYRIIGRGTALLSGKRQGEHLSALGPLGRGFPGPGKRNFPVLIGGGVGLAPLLYLAQSLTRSDSREEAPTFGRGSLLFLAGFSNKKEVIPLTEVVEPLPRLSVSTEDGSLGHHGLVTDLFQKHLISFTERQEKVRVFACGPSGMLKKIFRICSVEGLECWVSLETHMACGLGACLGCAVRAAPETGRTYYHVCKDGPVFNASDIDWTAIG
jgi:dihydroorotate dehydrogenase electron transfer subunit